MFCFLGIHRYKKICETKKGDVHTEIFSCKHCEKVKTSNYNPNQKYRCEYCGLGENKCTCNAC